MRGAYCRACGDYVVEDSGRAGKGTYCRLVSVAAFMEDCFADGFWGVCFDRSAKRGEGEEDGMVVGDSCSGRKTLDLVIRLPPRKLSQVNFNSNMV